LLVKVYTLIIVQEHMFFVKKGCHFYANSCQNCSKTQSLKELFTKSKQTKWFTSSENFFCL